LLRVCAATVRGIEIPRRTGIVASVAFLAASAAFGAVKGDHIPMMVEALTDTRDAMANAAGFRIAAASVTGEKHLDQAAILSAAGVTGRTSLLFLDVDATRARLEAVPWIAGATVRKLYPNHLQISVTEREPFALWQLAGQISVISNEGTAIAPLSGPEFTKLPLVVGPGAGPRARAFLALLDAHPEVRSKVRASILVAERRWDLRLDNGLDVQLPETGVEQALDLLARLDREKQLLSRDISVVDLRLPDRVSVRLSEETAKAREQARKEKDKASKRKGEDA
jgi:cell division protein FtsQ